MFLYEIYFIWFLACRGGKPADVMIFLDVSKYLTKDQFEVQLQRAEHMVRLLRNFKSKNGKYNRILIYTVSERRIDPIAKFKKNGKIGTKYTEELSNLLRSLHSKYVISNGHSGSGRWKVCSYVARYFVI